MKDILNQIVGKTTPTKEFVAQQIIEAIRYLAGNTIFNVVFIKRTTGEQRNMTCRLDVRKHVKGDKGTGRAYDMEGKGLIPVYDVQKRGYRTVPVDGIVSITIKGETFTAGRE